MQMHRKWLSSLAKKREEENVFFGPEHSLNKAHGGPC